MDSCRKSVFSHTQLAIMKRILALSLGVVISGNVFSQATTWESVYSVLQTNCGSCHVAGHESGLDLSVAAADMYDALVEVTPTNAISAGKGYKRVFAGDPYRSFLFSKINNSLALDVNLEAGEGAACPQGAAPLNNKDIELVRQWILYGAQESDTIVDIALINEFYDNDGIQSMPSPPAPPAPGEGFQIHFGPFFLWPETENEYFSKYPVFLPEDQEINRVDTYMGPYSHHFITYKYINPIVEAATEPGLHEGPDFAGIDLVTAHQYSDSIILPEGTAFRWDVGTVLDLNSHYINYSADKAMASEAYVNVYTQPVGTAVQTMVSVLLSNQSFSIPANGLPYTDEASAFENGHGDDKLFIWGLSTHAHKLSTDFDVYMRTEDGDKGEHIFDASCYATNGIPGCIDEIYDYQHPPIRYWDSFKPVKWEDGIIYEAEWINTGDETITFGFTSEDEMMIVFYFYVDDTTGLNLPTAISEVPAALEEMSIFPNPANDRIYIKSTVDISGALLSLTNTQGQTVISTTATPTAGSYAVLSVESLPAGMYLLDIQLPDGTRYAERVVLR